MSAPAAAAKRHISLCGCVHHFYTGGHFRQPVYPSLREYIFRHALISPLIMYSIPHFLFEGQTFSIAALAIRFCFESLQLPEPGTGKGATALAGRTICLTACAAAPFPVREVSVPTHRLKADSLPLAGTLFPPAGKHPHPPPRFLYKSTHSKNAH